MLLTEHDSPPLAKQVSILIQECKWEVTGHTAESILLIALLNDTIVGSSTVRIDRLKKDELHFESTFVGEDYRGAGIASLLNHKRLELATQCNAKKIWVTVYRKNKFHLKWFIKHGFKIHSKDDVRDTMRLLKEL